MADVEACIASATTMLGLPTGKTLDVAMRALKDEAALNELGWFAFCAEAAHAIATQQAFINAPEPATHGTPGDIIVGGLPRTGTTLMHHLLSLAGDLRAPRSWEVQFPVPAVRSEANKRSAMERSAARYEMLAALAPKVGQMHPLEADGLEECTPLLQHSLLCLQTVVMFRIPSFARWLYHQDMTPVYRFWAQQLAALRGNVPTRRLVLKSPLHFVGYDALLGERSPGLLVHVRRPLKPMLSSFLQLVESTRAVFTEAPLDRSAIAEEWAEYLDSFLARATQAIYRHRPEIVTIDYDELLRAPWHAVRAICAVAGTPAPSRQAVEQCAAHLCRQHEYRREPYSDLDLAPAVERLAGFAGGPFIA